MSFIGRAGALLLFLALCPTIVFAASATIITPEMQKAAEQITRKDIRAHVRFLSADSLEGRGPATQADKITQDYLRSEMESMGIKPGAPNGSWIQNVPLVGITTHAPKTLTLSRGTKALTLNNHDDFIASSGVQQTEANINNAEIVFVGYGIKALEYDWDDFKDVDVKGKVLLVMNYNPPVFAGKTRLYYGRWTYKFEEAARRGAAGVIIIHTTPSAAYPWQVVQSSWSGELFELKDEGGPRIKMKGWATEDASRKIVALSDKDLDKLRKLAESKNFKPVSLGVKFSIDLNNEIKTVQSANVIGKIPGIDPKLANEAIVYSAHHDHLGKKRNEKTGKTLIYNGAIDNASGTAALMSIAKAFTNLEQPVKRTVYFAFMAAEEQGLLGSKYFVAHPPLPVGKITADINIDGAGFYGKTEDMFLYGAGKSTIDHDLNAIAKVLGREIRPDPYPERGSFYRADHLSFAKAGVPVVYMHTGVNVIGKSAEWGIQQQKHYIKHDYHQPSDTFKDSFNFSGAVADARLEFYLGVVLANAKTMPTWQKGDEFEAARLRSLNDVKNNFDG